MRSGNCNQFDLTTDEIRCLPDATINLAFHFEADSLGNNFTCDPNSPIIVNRIDGTTFVVNQPDETLWYAPKFVNTLLNGMNGMHDKMDNALILNGQNENSKINFKLNGDGSCGQALFFYPHGQSANRIPGAINIEFESPSMSTMTIGGAAPVPGDFIVMRDIINDWVNENRRWWIVSNTILHEFGHTRSLHHTFYCSNVCHMNGLDVNNECCQHGCIPSTFTGPCNGCSPNNWMMSYSGNQSFFTECEFGEMWNYMINNQSDYQIIETCDLPPNNEKIIYDENAAIVWNSKKIFTKHVVIKSGTTITVNCEVQMGDDKEIVVEQGAKLVVNGGTITSICEKPWRGIKAYGGDDSYVVEIKNGSRINNTSQGAVSMFHDGGWLLGTGNAHVLIQGSHFEDCNRVLEMGTTLNNDFNLSKIEGNVQNGGKYGVTNWNCLNVVVSNNEFNSIQKTCIVNSGEMKILENKFRGFESDILFPSETPNISSTIDNNDFYANQGGIVMLGAGVANHQIINNRFHSNIINIWMEGDNHYLIGKNSIRGQVGGIFVNNGDKFNLVIDNDIFSSSIGLRADGTNDCFVINENCFLTGEKDNYVNGSIGRIQGRANSVNSSVSLLPANNCFTHRGSSGSNIKDLAGWTPDTILYIEPNDNFDDCRDAIHADPTFKTRKNGNSEVPCNVSIDDPDDPNDPCFPEKDLNKVNQSLFQLQNEINGLSVESPEHKVYQRCYEAVFSLWIELSLVEGEYEQVRTALSESLDDDSKILIFKSYLLENDFVKAKQFLTSLTSTNEQLSDFIIIQLINLKRLESNLEYQASSSEINDIFNIATKNHPYATYAKSLYYWITGDLILTELPPIIDNNIEERKSESVVKDETIGLNVFPNPFENYINIDFKNNSNEKVEIVISDLLGRQIFEIKTKNSFNRVSTLDWEEGVYMLQIYKKDSLIESKKVFLIR